MTFKLHTAPLSLVLAAALVVTACSTEDSYNEPQTKAISENQAIAFGSYVGRSAQTRGTPFMEPAEIALNGGVGIFAMYTKGGMYAPTSQNENDVKEYTDNFMQNSHLQSSLSNDEITSDDDHTQSVRDNWVYQPIRYWPMMPDEYTSFMAYAPYSANGGTLYNKEGKAEDGDATYIKHSVESDPRDQIDLMYSSPDGITNMQLYKKADGTWYRNEKDSFYVKDENSIPKVDLYLKHATSRIGFVVTSSALNDPRNFAYEDEGGKKYSWGDIESGMSIDLIVSADAENSITVNKVIFLGDGTSAEASPIQGAFYPTGYLNLSTTSDDKPLWSNIDSEKTHQLAFVYDNTQKIVNGTETKDSIRTSNGSYAGSLDNSRESDWRFYDSDNKPTTGYYLWIPSEYTEDNTATKWYNRFREDSLAYEDVMKKMRDALNDYTSSDDDVFATYAEAHGNDADFSDNYGNPHNQYKNWLKQMRWALDYDFTSSDKDIIKKYFSQLYEEYYQSLCGNVLKATWDPDEKESTVNYIGNRANDYMFVIPEDFTENSGNDLWVYLDYTVNYNGGVSGTVAENGVNYKIYKKVNPTKAFEPGKAYIIVMDIGTGNQFNTINFSVQTDNWSDENKVGVDF